MDLIRLVLILCLVGFVIHWLTTVLKLDPEWRTMVRVVALLLLLLYLAGRIGGIPNFLPR